MTPPENTPEAPDTDDTDDTDTAAAREATKAKFRDALAHKQKRRGEDHIDFDPQQPGAHGPVNEKRTFRRKTG